MVIFLIVCSAGFSSVSAFEITEVNGPEFVAGASFPSFGWANYNAAGQLTRYRGINYLLGYSQKNFFNPAEANDFNLFWGFGTFGIILPYVSVGGDYIIPIGDLANNQYLTIGGSVALNLMTIILPAIEVSFAW